VHCRLEVPGGESGEKGAGEEGLVVPARTYFAERGGDKKHYGEKGWRKRFFWEGEKQQRVLKKRGKKTPQFCAKEHLREKGRIFSPRGGASRKRDLGTKKPPGGASNNHSLKGETFTKRRRKNQVLNRCGLPGRNPFMPTLTGKREASPPPKKP